MAERMSDQEPANTVVVIQLLDNITFECHLENCDKTLPNRGDDGKFHVEGERKVFGKNSLRDLFMKMQPIFKAIKGFRGIVLSPLPRCLLSRCCSIPVHITNSKRSTYAGDMGTGLRELTVNSGT